MLDIDRVILSFPEDISVAQNKGTQENTSSGFTKEEEVPPEILMITSALRGKDQFDIFPDKGLGELWD